MTKTKKSATTAQVIASKSNHNRETSTGLYAFRVDLYHTSDGRYYTRETGGPALRVDNQPDYLSKAEAIEWIATEARDWTGWGYTRSQAEQMADGIDAGKGYRADSDTCEQDSIDRRLAWE